MDTSLQSGLLQPGNHIDSEEHMGQILILHDLQTIYTVTKERATQILLDRYRFTSLAIGFEKLTKQN